MTTLYSATLLVVGPMQVPPEATNYPEGEYMTHAAEAKLQVWRLAPSVKPTNLSEDI